MAEMTIKRFSIFSVAKMQALLMFVIGLIFGVIYGLIFMIFGAAIAAMVPQGDAQTGGIGSVVIGLIMMIAFPLIYTVIGFIGGAIGALIYNIAAGVVGGIKVELEDATPVYAPPQQQPWAPEPYPGRA
jgi:hypothetical protein